MHDPDHGHSHGEFHSHEETLALLKYMADHTSHHAEELHELAHSVEGDAAEQIHEACYCLQDGVEKIRKALSLLV